MDRPRLLILRWWTTLAMSHCSGRSVSLPSPPCLILLHLSALHRFRRHCCYLMGVVGFIISCGGVDCTMKRGSDWGRIWSPPSHTTRCQNHKDFFPFKTFPKHVFFLLLSQIESSLYSSSQAHFHALYSHENTNCFQFFPPVLQCKWCCHHLIIHCHQIEPLSYDN